LLTYCSDDWKIVMETLWKRCNEVPKNWRCVYKGLQLLEYLIAYGSENCVDDAVSNMGRLKILSNFSYVEETSTGKKIDHGENVRTLAAKLMKLLNDQGAIEELRSKAGKGEFEPYTPRKTPVPTSTSTPPHNSLSKGTGSRSSSVNDFKEIDADSIYSPPRSMRSPPQLNKQGSMRTPRRYLDDGEEKSGTLSNSSSYSDFNDIPQHEEASKLKQQIESLQRKEQEQRQRADELQSQLHSLQDELHSQRKPIEQPIRQYVKQEFQDPRLSITREQRLQIQVDRQTNEIRTLQKERDDAMQQLQKAKREHQDMEQQQKYAQDQLQHIKDELNQVLETKTKELKGEKEQLEQRQKQEGELLRVKIASLEREVGEANRQLDDVRQQLSEERSTREKDRQEADEKLNTVVADVRRLESEKNDLQQRKDTLTQEKEELERKYSQAKKTLGEERVTLSVTREQVEELTKGLQSAVQENERLTTTLSESKVALENSIKEITDLREQLKTSKQESTKALQEAKTLLQKVEGHLNEKKRLEAQVQEIQAQLSQANTELSKKDQTFVDYLTQVKKQRKEQNDQFNELVGRLHEGLNVNKHS
jgi:epsin